ncbi:MAG: AAA family ATPase [Dysgonamonadaceae bacterium]|jgi:putative ATP-dependent endonuclease of OLD family|nr:AAA family ATPase [Dysgonamonadaceae bacterium]
MYLHELKLWNFRKYGIIGDVFETAEPGLKVQFKQGVNVLVGENDSGKTTIVDAIRYVLRTQSLEYIQVEDKDFHQDDSGHRKIEMKIECIFKGFSDLEAGHFLEWIGLETEEDGKNEYILKVWLYARIRDNFIYQYVRAGIDAEGNYIEGDARDLLRVVYLKPLRDALTEMTHGNKSRLSQILKSHSVFKKIKNAEGNEEKHELEKQYKKLKDNIDSYFKETDQQAGKIITKTINNLLHGKFLLENDTRKAVVSLTGSELIDILKQLDLILEKNKSGLGTLNLLFIAAELLLFEEANNGLKLTLIEELEAHLHPQYQLRLIDFINTNKKYGQFILTTHSTILASKIDLESLIVCNKNHVFPMGKDFTNLASADYKFLERFLDATKANLFFARGVIIVEGDAENLLIPTIADIIERPLHKYGVSIVNVGGTAYKRYANIFIRKEKPSFDVNVAIISDLDIPSLEHKPDIATNETDLRNLRISRKNEQKKLWDNARPVEIFLPEQWTLEYEIASSKLYKYLCQAIALAKREKANSGFEADETVYEEVKSEINEKYTTEILLNKQEIYDIFKSIYKNNVSKAVVAQYFAAIMIRERDAGMNIKDMISSDLYLKYIIDAISYVTEPIITESSNPE